MKKKKAYKKPTIIKFSAKDINVGNVSCWQCDVKPF